MNQLTKLAYDNWVLPALEINNMINEITGEPIDLVMNTMMKRFLSLKPREAVAQLEYFLNSGHQEMLPDFARDTKRLK